jgi:5-methylcytosine-specific restriction enzyme subunit McrC
MLLYAKTNDGIMPNSAYKLGRNRISVKMLDLGEKFSRIRDQLENIVNEWAAY